MSTDMQMAPYLPSQVPARPFMPEGDDLVRLRRWVEECWSVTQTARDWAKEDRRMYDGDQLSATMKRVLRRRGQPEVIDNLIRPAVNGLLGVLDQSRTDPRAYPRNAQDQAAADIASKALRFAAEEGKFDKIKLSAAKTYFTSDAVGVLVESGEEGAVTYTDIKQGELIYDPHAKRLDFSDARYLGIGKWFYADDVRRMYPERWAELGDPFSVSPLGGINDMTDKPDMALWADRKACRLFMVELYYRDGGQWVRVVYCASGAFEAAPSPYQDDKGRSVCPIIAVSYEIDQENRRYSHVRDMVTLQHSVNARKSRLSHLTNTRQVQQVDPGAAPVDAAIAKAEAAKADGVIPAGWQVVPTADLSAGQSALLADDRAQLQRMGPTPAVLGRADGASQSGRSRLVLQQAGMTELAPAMAGIEDLEERVYAQTWWRIRQFWPANKWVRVTDNIRAPEMVMVNEVVGQQITGVDPETGQPIVEPIMKNRLAEMDMDIIIGTTPDTATMEQETFAELVKLTGGNLQAVMTPEFELMIEASPLSDKTRILELLRSKREENDQQQGQMQQMQQQIQEVMTRLEIAEREAKIAKTTAETAKIEADTVQTGYEMAGNALTQDR